MSDIKRECTRFCSSVSINTGFLIKVCCRPDHQKQQEYISLIDGDRIDVLTENLHKL